MMVRGWRGCTPVLVALEEMFCELDVVADVSLLFLFETRGDKHFLNDL